MYYEERFVAGELWYRTTPDGDWTRASAATAGAKLMEARKENRALRAKLDRCREIMECNDPIAARDIFGTPTIHG